MGTARTRKNSGAAEQSPAQMLQTALQLLEEERWEEAARLFRHLLPALREAVGKCSAHTTQALEQSQPSKSPQDDATSPYRWREERKFVKRLVKRLVLALTGLAQCLIQTGDFDEAVTLTEEAVRVAPNSLNAVKAHAAVLATAGRYGDALKWLERVLKREEGNAEIEVLAGQVCLRLDRLKEAEEHCRRALRIKPTLVQGYLTLSEVFYQQGETELALRTLLCANLCSPDDPSLLFRIAQIQHELGQTQDAIQTLEQVIRLSPDNELAYETLAGFYVDVGNYRKVAYYCEKALKINPKNFSALDLLAFAHLQCGDVDAAIQTMSRVVYLTPTDPLARFKLATLYHQKAVYKQAMAEYQQVVDLSPKGILSKDAQQAIEQLDRHQLEQIFTLSAVDSVFRAKLARDPAEAIRERGFQLTENSLEILKNTDFSMLPEPFPRNPTWGIS